ncbi:LysR family transcriptional regulator [Saccharopolyspora sp. TS4A08]|uniref:LysR family transcriptional regulator n=1 Tax=Saccharopolyspora ipomoeae TaxID=3042027 RepID=A0ABT6PVF1_9PSEU|nr:LysR family transcriptional regulator [Saccharopolyspora sp. TS4A08]MDI2031989.1 LysR family transcriptional regulator [Saccharopolyspora sp. TS4A08]
MELRQLTYVVAVAESGSFTRAAHRCFVVQSALSEQIARLEKELGTKLFERTSRRVRITPAGEAFLGPAREALAAAERAAGNAVACGGEVRGNLVIGTITPLTAVDLPGVLATYRDRHPAVRITLRTRLVRDLLQQVREHACHVAFVDARPGELPRGLAGRVLRQDELVAIVPHGHPLADAPRLSPAQLAEEDMVDMQSGSGIRPHNDAAFDAAGVTRAVAFEADSMALLEQLVARGLGVGLVSAPTAARMSGVRSVPTTGVPPRTVQVLWPTSGTSPATEAFLQLLREEVPPEAE